MFFTTSSPELSFWVRSAGLLLILLTAAIVSESTGLDFWLENWFFDTSLNKFPLQNNYWLTTVFHKGLREVLALVYIAILLISAWQTRRWQADSLGWVRHLGAPRVLVYLSSVFLLAPVVVGLLKRTSTRVCPWDMDIYGGSIGVQHLLTEPLFDMAQAGNCFPGAHALTGFMLFALVPLLGASYRVAFSCAVLLLGSFAGFVQMARGAHFLSHNLWTAAICWAITLAAYYSLVRRKDVQPQLGKDFGISGQELS